MTERLPATAPGRVAIWLLLTAGLGLGVWLRATPLASAFLFGDELHSLPALGRPWLELAGRYDAVGSGLALPMLQKALVAAFGPSLPALRAVAFLPSICLVAVAALWARREAEARSARAAMAGAALLAALLPSLVFYGHFARSYSLAALLCAGTATACARALGRPPGAGSRDGRTVALGALLGGLAIWAHLVSAFFLAGLGLGVLVAVVARRGALGVIRAPALLALVGAALVAGLLYWPAASDVLTFVGRKGEQVYYAGFGPMDVLGVLTGSGVGAWIALVSLAGSAALELHARRAAAAPIVAATIVPGVLLWIVSPYGDAYAYARYLVPSAAAGCVLVALGSVRLAGLAPGAAGRLPAGAAAGALALTLFLAGPRGPFAPDLGRFANTYLGLRELPVFTDTMPVPPAWYETIRGSRGQRTLIEVPPLRNRAVHYLEALQRWHGQDVRMGTFGPIVPGAPMLESDLYVDLTQVDVKRGDADALVVHRRIVDEVRRHWQRVYASVPDAERDALLERHMLYGHDLPSLGPGVVEKLEALLGEPTHVDVDIVVWRFDAPPASAP